MEKPRLPALLPFRLDFLRGRGAGCYSLIALFLAGIPLAALPFLPRVYTALRFADDTYPLEEVPVQPVAIVFGSQVEPSGQLSPILRDRVRAGAALYHAGKVKWLLMSGNNADWVSNQTDAMRRYAIELGVPSEAIQMDEVGYRTYNTCYRAKHVFGIESAILVTQAYHLDRALLLCNELGIRAVGVAADAFGSGYDERQLTRSQLREIAATALAVFDLLRQEQPPSTHRTRSQ